MRARFPHLAFLGGVLLLAGCSAPAPAPAAEPAASAPPSTSAAPAVRFEAPAKLKGLPRTTADKWTKGPKSTTTFFRRKVQSPTGTLAAAYLDPDDISQSIEVSAAAGRVYDPAVTLRQLVANLELELADVRPADPGTPGGVGTCGLSRKNQPAVVTLCHWAEPGSVGSVTIWSLADRRDWFADVRAQIQP